MRALWEHLDSGRLTPGEHEERCAHAMAATTRAELETLFDDLPAPHPDLSAAVHPNRGTPRGKTTPPKAVPPKAVPPKAVPPKAVPPKAVLPKAVVATDADPPPLLSETLAGVGLLVLVAGITAAVILTVQYGMWWTFFPVVGLTIAIWVLSDVVERREKRPEDTVS